MNCKPGDLAIYVGSLYSGMIFKVVAPYCDKTWVVDPMPKGLIAIADKNLRPIRDPGDDATDETLTCLPVPSRESETA